MITPLFSQQSESSASPASPLNRRAALRSLSALGLFGLSSLTRGGSGWAQQPSITPKRFLIVLEGNGFEPVTLLSQDARAALNATLEQPLSTERWWHRRYRHNSPIISAGSLNTAPALTGLGDLESEATALFGLSSKIAGGGHSSLHGALSSARSTGGAPGGETIDAWLARQESVRGASPYDAIRLGVGVDPERPLDFGTCAYERGRAAPLMLKPRQAYQALFGPVSDERGARAFMQSGRQLEVVIEDVQEKLLSLNAYPNERLKLESYLVALESRLLLRERVAALGERLNAFVPVAPVSTDDPLERLQQQLELATATLLSGLTHVCVVGCGTGDDFNLRYPSIISNIGRHDLHHGSELNTSYREAIHEVTRRQVDMICQVARRLRSTPDISGGNALDHTLIIYIGDNGEQHHSTASEFPILLLGGRGLGRSGLGETIIYPGLNEAGHRQVSNLWNTLSHLAGASRDDFGHEGRTRRALGPLSHLFS